MKTAVQTEPFRGNEATTKELEMKTAAQTEQFAGENRSQKETEMNKMLRQVKNRPTWLALAAALLSLSLVSTAQASLFLHWEMNGDAATALVDSVGSQDLVQDGTNPTTFAPTDGVGGSGAWRFNTGGSDIDRMGFTIGTQQPMHPLGPENAREWTASFWVKTSDGTAGGPQLYQPQIPVLFSEWTDFGLGVDGGVPYMQKWDYDLIPDPDPGHKREVGTVNVADGLGHYVTFVHRDLPVGGAMDMYVDGVFDATVDAHEAVNDNCFYFHGLGRPHMNGSPTFGDFFLDDVRLYDTALSAGEIRELFGPSADGAEIPEPATMMLLGSGLVGVLRRRRRK